MKILHVFDHTLPLHSGYTFRSAAILRNQRKMGFAVPLEAWFRGPLAVTIRNVVLGERLASTGLFNQGYLRQVVEAHQSGRRDYSVILWTVLMFDAFLGQVLGMDETERQAA